MKFSILFSILVLGLVTFTSSVSAQHHDPFIVLQDDGAAPVTIVVQPYQHPAGYAGNTAYAQHPLQLELTNLRAEYSQYRLGGPITIMSIGLGIGLILASLALPDYCSNSYSSCDSESDTRRKLGLSSLVFGSAGIAGLVWMIRRIRARRPIRTRIRALRLQLRSMGIHAGTGPEYAPPNVALFTF